jgi:hypothetical protein
MVYLRKDSRWRREILPVRVGDWLARQESQESGSIKSMIKDQAKDRVPNPGRRLHTVASFMDGF